MRKLGRTSTDSLELLLDTVCSMFGAIILIAILVALLAQTAKVDPSMGKANAEMLQRKIATAEEDLAQARQFKEHLSKPANEGIAAMVMEKQHLEEAIKAARERREHIGEQLKGQIALQSVDFSTESKKLSADLLANQRKHIELTNAIKAQNENSARLHERVTALDQQIHKTKEERVAKLRLPKERSPTKDTFNVILKYNRVYPLLDSRLAENRETLSWEPLFSGDAQAVSPIRGKGLDAAADRAQIAALIHDLRDSGVYFAFYVYADSFETFRTLKDIVVEGGGDFGWEPVMQDVKLKFGKHGHSPPPL